MILTILLSLAMGITSPIIDKHLEFVDLIEINTVRSKTGSTFTQVIAWKVVPEDNNRLHTCGWFMVDAFNYPVRHGKVYHATHNKITAYSTQIRYSYSTVDPEREDSASFWKNKPPNIFSPSPITREHLEEPNP